MLESKMNKILCEHFGFANGDLTESNGIRLLDLFGWGFMLTSGSESGLLTEREGLQEACSWQLVPIAYFECRNQPDQALEFCHLTQTVRIPK